MQAENMTFDIGPFKVHQRPRFDNPAFAVYIVMLGTMLIGKSFSRPDLSCCEWLQRTNGVYASSSANLKELTGPRRDAGYTVPNKRRRAAMA